MTETQYHVLMFCHRHEFVAAYAIYPVMCPNGQFLHRRDHGSAKGGPSRTEYAVNNYMGKLIRRGWVEKRYGWDRVLFADGTPGGFSLTPAGVEALRTHWWSRQRGKTKLCQTCGGDFLPVNKSRWSCLCKPD
jgi:hypothetical protein